MLGCCTVQRAVQWSLLTHLFHGSFSRITRKRHPFCQGLLLSNVARPSTLTHVLVPYVPSQDFEILLDDDSGAPPPAPAPVPAAAAVAHGPLAGSGGSGHLATAGSLTSQNSFKVHSSTHLKYVRPGLENPGAKAAGGFPGPPSTSGRAPGLGPAELTPQKSSSSAIPGILASRVTPGGSIPPPRPPPGGPPLGIFPGPPAGPYPGPPQGPDPAAAAAAAAAAVRQQQEAAILPAGIVPMGHAGQLVAARLRDVGAMWPSQANDGQPIKMPRQTKVGPEEYKEFLALGHGEIFTLDLDR